MPNVTLKSIKYCEFPGEDLEWSLDTLTLGAVNLLVGKNATGKTRVLNLIANLAKNLLNKGAVIHTELGCDATFESDGTEIRYELNVHGGEVKRERVTIDGIVRLKRENGLLKIWAEEMKVEISFRPDASEITAVARRDSMQHSFLTPLHQWADALRHYHFGDSLGKDNMLVYVSGKTILNRITNSPALDDRNEHAIVEIYKNARKQLGSDFDDAIIADMKEMGYDITAIEIAVPQGVEVKSNIPVSGTLTAIGVRERGVGGIVFQHQMSHGMFRAFSVITQVNFSQMTQRATCILIDDIGEGLDFDRSGKLIDILRNKARTSQFQLIMSTNDRFVMNHVPLEEWSLLQRSGSHVSVKNIGNSREQFEDFKFVGLSNFTFFEMDFVNGAPEDINDLE